MPVDAALFERALTLYGDRIPDLVLRRSDPDAAYDRDDPHVVAPLIVVRIPNLRRLSCKGTLRSSAETQGHRQKRGRTCGGLEEQTDVHR